MNSGKTAKYVSMALVLTLLVILISMCVNIEIKLQGLMKADPVVIYSVDDETTTAESVTSVTETCPYTFNQSKYSVQPEDNTTTVISQSTAEVINYIDTTSQINTEAYTSLYQPSQEITVTTTIASEILADSYHQYTEPPVLTSPPEVITEITLNSVTTEAPSVTSSISMPYDNSATFTYFVTNTGTKYHLSECSYLNKSKIPVTYDEIIAGGYEPCSRCFK